VQTALALTRQPPRMHPTLTLRGSQIPRRMHPGRRPLIDVFQLSPSPSHINFHGQIHVLEVLSNVHSMLQIICTQLASVF